MTGSVSDVNTQGVRDLEKLGWDEEEAVALVRVAVHQGHFAGAEWCLQGESGPWAAADASVLQRVRCLWLGAGWGGGAERQQAGDVGVQETGRWAAVRFGYPRLAQVLGIYAKRGCPVVQWRAGCIFEVRKR